jgi:hypothetical protein
VLFSDASFVLNSTIHQMVKKLEQQFFVPPSKLGNRLYSVQSMVAIRNILGARKMRYSLWLSRSPDLTTCMTYLGRSLNDNSFNSNPQRQDELKGIIITSARSYKRYLLN